MPLIQFFKRLRFAPRLTPLRLALLAANLLVAFVSWYLLESPIASSYVATAHVGFSRSNVDIDAELTRLRASDLSLAVMAELNLAASPDFSGRRHSPVSEFITGLFVKPESPLQVRALMLQRWSELVRVSIDADQRRLDIAVRAGDPSLAALVANSLTSRFVAASDSALQADNTPSLFAGGPVNLALVQPAVLPDRIFVPAQVSQVAGSGHGVFALPGLVLALIAAAGLFIRPARKAVLDLSRSPPVTVCIPLPARNSIQRPALRQIKTASEPDLAEYLSKRQAAGRPSCTLLHGFAPADVSTACRALAEDMPILLIDIGWSDDECGENRASCLGDQIRRDHESAQTGRGLTHMRLGTSALGASEWPVALPILQETFAHIVFVSNGQAELIADELALLLTHAVFHDHPAQDVSNDQMIAALVSANQCEMCFMPTLLPALFREAA